MLSVKHESLKNEIYQPYFTINMNSALSKPAKIMGSYKKLSYPKIGIYNGTGASHSWLWFVDILDAMGFWDIEFVDEQKIKNGGLNNLHVFLVSGGDTFAIAYSLGKNGAERLKSFLENGGIYIGSCAGAYLPLKSSLPPLNLFNFASAQISNLTKSLPEPITLPEKFCTSYGCRYVFHPVREEVKITLTDYSFPQQNRELVAPLYGGPSFLPSTSVKTLAHYTGFTKHTLFMTDHKIAYDILIGNSAIVAKKIGKGQLFLLGPHLEHPHYFKANTLISDMIHQGMGEKEVNSSFSIPSNRTSKCKNLHTLWRDIKSQVSNSRIVALSLAREQLKWQIGYKTYEPEKIREFLEVIWSRWDKINIQKCGSEIELYSILTMAKRLTKLLRAIKKHILMEADTTKSAQEMFLLLKMITASFLTLYFKELRSTITCGGIN